MTSVCSGTLQRQSLTLGSAPTTLGPSDYTFDFVFAAPWPGAIEGFDVILPVTQDQYVAIPFKPIAKAATVLRQEFNPTVGSFMSISTAPGLFNGGKANGTTVLCATPNSATGLPISTDGTLKTCALDPDTVYWLNVAPSVAATKGWGIALTQSPMFRESCVDGTPGDVPGFTARCSGKFSVFTPTEQVFGPTAFTFDSVFGGTWPGARFGLTVVFKQIATQFASQFIAIPFRPSPAHTVLLNSNDTYTPGTRAVFSVSTAPGLFNNGTANGTTVLCVHGEFPSISVSSNGAASVNCMLDPSRTYWFNMIAGIFINGTFTASCASGCNVAVQALLLN